MKKNIVALLAATAAVAFIGSANAATIHISSQSTTDFVADPGFGVPTGPSSGTATFQTLSIGGITRSPYEDASQAQNPAHGYGDTYLNVAAAGSATWNVSASTHFTLLWGSPDDYNLISFYSGTNGGGTLLGSFSSVTPNLLGIQQLGHDLVTFDTDIGSTFQSYVITSTNNAFEFADNVASCGGERDCAPPPGTPLPAALPLFVSGLGGLGFLGFWRKKKSTKQTAAA